MNSDRSYYRNVRDIIEEFRPGLPPAHRGGSGWNGKKIRRIAVRVLLSFCLVAATLYVGDYVVARYRLSRGYGLDNLNVAHLYAIRQKSGKTEYEDLGTQPETCVRSLFPHFGYAPCWYLRRHREQQTKF